MSLLTAKFIWLVQVIWNQPNKFGDYESPLIINLKDYLANFEERIDRSDFENLAYLSTSIFFGWTQFSKNWIFKGWKHKW